MAVVETSFVYIILFFASASIASRSFPGASALLLQLRLFHILPDSSSDSDAAAKKGGKAAKDGQGGAQGLVTDLRSAQTFSRPLSLRDLKQLNRQLMPFHDMASLLLAVTLQLVFSEALSRLFGRDTSPFLACLSIFCLLQSTLRALLPTVIAPLTSTGRVQRTQTWAVLAAMLMLSVLFLLILQAKLLDVDVELGASALEATGKFWEDSARTAARLAAFVRRGQLSDAAEYLERGGSAAHHPCAVRGVPSEQWSAEQRLAADSFAAEGRTCVDMTVETLRPARTAIAALVLPLAAATGAYAGLLLLPLLRYARCAAAALHPPIELPGEASGQALQLSMPLAAPLTARLAVHAAVAVPSLSVLLWLQPFVSGALGVSSSEACCAMQAGALLLSGVLQLVAIRPLLQAYFNSAMFAWYRAKFSTCKPTERKMIAMQTGALVGNINALFPTVAIQLAAPGVVMIVLGALLWDGLGWHRAAADVPEAEQLFKNVLTDFVNPNKDLLRVAASAGGAAASAAHAAVVLGGMTLCQMGVIRL